MATVEELQAQRAELVKLRGGGARSVSHGDKRADFRSLDEINEAIRLLDDDIAALQGRKRSRVIKLYTNRGL